MTRFHLACVPSGIPRWTMLLASSYSVALGRHTQLVKIDLKDAYRILPIHPDDRHLLGISWEDHIYVDLCLPFGLCSAPKIFTAFADILAWVLHCCGVRHLIQYLDDFLIFWSHFTGEAHSALRIAMDVLADLHIPISLPKLEGPSTIVSFWGFSLILCGWSCDYPMTSCSV